MKPGEFPVVLVQPGAGARTGFSDADYLEGAIAKAIKPRRMLSRQEQDSKAI